MLIIGIDPSMRDCGMVVAEGNPNDPLGTFQVIDWEVSSLARSEVSRIEPEHVCTKARKDFLWVKKTWERLAADKQPIPCIAIEWAFIGRPSQGLQNHIGYVYQLFFLLKTWTDKLTRGTRSRVTRIPPMKHKRYLARVGGPKLYGEDYKTPKGTLASKSVTQQLVNRLFLDSREKGLPHPAAKTEREWHTLRKVSKTSKRDVSLRYAAVADACSVAVCGLSLWVTNSPKAE